MADHPQRSYLRDGTGPQVVDSSNGRRDRPRGSNRRERDGESGEKHRSKRNDAHRSSKRGSGHRRKVSNSGSRTTVVEPPTFELDVIGQPAQGVPLGMPVETSVLISVNQTSTDRSINANSIDTSCLFAMTSLIADGSNDDRQPIEAGSMTGQKIYDSVHPIPEECVASLTASQPRRVALGYFSFPGLFIRQSGMFRIRTTLIQMNSEGATSLLAIDSEPIRVERRGSGTQRRHQRVSI